MVGLATGLRTHSHAASAGSARRASAMPAGTGLDVRARPVYAALNRVRSRAGLPVLNLDDALVETAARDACAIARGELPLDSDRQRLREVGGQRENVGMVIDEDPVAGARTMHDWWTHVGQHRRDRMHPEMVRYGIGACTLEDRTYYVERFAS